MTDTMKNTIDNMTYEEMLSRWRFAAIGDPMFSGEVGDYFTAVFAQKRKSVSNAQHVQASKNLGWNK